MNYNRNFGKVIDGRLFYSPKFLTADLRPHGDEDYLADGWLPVEVALPDPPDGCYCALTRYVVADGVIRAEYEYAAIPDFADTNEGEPTV